MLAKKYEQAKKTGILDVSDMNLKVLPDLPANIVRLDCSKNQLTCLPALPESLTGLNCYKNQLTCLPDLPDALQELYCSFNSLTSLPDLPESLTHLYCSSNQLTCLPNMPDSLNYLICSNNPWNNQFARIVGSDPIRSIQSYYNDHDVSTCFRNKYYNTIVDSIMRSFFYVTICHNP